MRAKVAFPWVVVLLAVGCQKAPAAQNDPRAHRVANEARIGKNIGADVEVPDLSESARRWMAPNTVRLVPEGSWGADGCGATEFVSFVLGNDKDGLRVKTKDCSAALDDLHRESAVQVGIKPFSILVSPVAVTAGETTVFAVKELCERLLAEEVSCRTDFLSVQWTVLSVVGPVVALQILEADAGAGGPSYHHESWLTMDLRTSRAAELDAMVSEESLTAALKAHPYLQETLQPGALRQLKDATTLAEVLAAWGTEEMRSYGEWGGHAFYGGEGGERMRLGFRRTTAGLSLNRLEVLELMVQPKPEAQSWFEAARRGDGYLSPP